MHGIVCNCTVLNVIALYCMVLHGPKLHWYCNYDLEWLMWHWCCAEWKSEKVTCPACWIYTGTLWHKELLSELTEGWLGMWVVYIHIEHCIHYVFVVVEWVWSWNSERVFSVAGNIVTPKRASLNRVKVEQLITVKCNMQLLSRVNLESTCRLFDFVDTVLEFEMHWTIRYSRFITIQIQWRSWMSQLTILELQHFVAGSDIWVHHKSVTFQFSEYLNDWTKKMKIITTQLLARVVKLFG